MLKFNMKKFVICGFILSILTVGAMAQKGQPGCTSATTPSGNIVFFGIDYSLARFSYISESSAYAVRIMPEINRLFITEAKKYDAGKLMGKNVVKISLNYANSVTDKLSDSNVIADEDYKISEDDVRALVAKYPDSNDEGIGLVFIAEQMSKKDAAGSYYVTFFSLKTREVLTTCRDTGKAGGFGMRNYWAATIYSLMKKWKIS
jgi:hypothetical protein